MALAPIRRRDILLGAVATPLAAQAFPGDDARGKDGFSLSHVELKCGSLHPSHDGLRIAHLSDIHVGRGTPDARIAIAVRTVAQHRPDMVFLTGDFVTDFRDPVERLAPLLSGLGVATYAVLGNHDHGVSAKGVKESLGKAGFTVLQNENTRVRFRGNELSIVGVDDEVTHRQDVAKSFKGVPTEGTRLVLHHAPWTAAKLPEDSGLLSFAGHTHGGQFILPRLMDGLLRRKGPPFLRGRYQLHSNQLDVSRGLGWGRGSPFPRLGSEPEVTMFTLRAVV